MFLRHLSPLILSTGNAVQVSLVMGDYQNYLQSATDIRTINFSLHM